jgi:hypothetical protein
MGMTFSGTVKSGGAYEVGGKDGEKKVLVSFNAVDEVGNAFACQMWPDDPQHAQLSQVIANMRRQTVTFEVAGYTVRMRKFKDGHEAPQANFVVTGVNFPNYRQQ